MTELYCTLTCVLVAVGFVVSRTSETDDRDALAAFASDHGFLFDKSDHMSGTYDDRSCRVYKVTRSGGVGGRSRTYTMYATDLCEEFPTDLEVREESMHSEIAESFGAQDIDVGDEELNFVFEFKSDRPERIRELFEREQINEMFRELAHLDRTARVEGGRLHLEEAGTPHSPEDVEEALDQLTESARRAEEGLQTHHDASDGASEAPDSSTTESSEPHSEASSADVSDDYSQHW